MIKKMFLAVALVGASFALSTPAKADHWRDCYRPPVHHHHHHFDSHRHGAGSLYYRSYRSPYGFNSYRHSVVSPYRSYYGGGFGYGYGFPGYGIGYPGFGRSGVSLHFGY